MVGDLVCLKISHIFHLKIRQIFRGGYYLFVHYNGGEEKINCFILACTNKNKLKFYTIYVNSLSKNPRFCLRHNPNSILDFNLTTIAGFTPVFYLTPELSNKNRCFGVNLNPAQTPTPTTFLDPGSYRITIPFFFFPTLTPAGYDPKKYLRPRPRRGNGPGKYCRPRSRFFFFFTPTPAGS